MHITIPCKRPGRGSSLLVLLLCISGVAASLTAVRAATPAATPTIFLPMLMRTGQSTPPTPTTPTPTTPTPTTPTPTTPTPTTPTPTTPTPTTPTPTTPTPTPVPGLPFDPRTTRAGIATFYDADGSGNCSFDPSPGDLLVGAMNHVDYAGAWLCGAHVEVTGPLGTIVVRITDQCPECQAGHIDLSREAFARIANPVDGRVPITWRIVSPALSGPIAYRFKEGSSQYWAAIQIRNHRTPVWKVEYQTAAGSFVALKREDYNYFIASPGMGPGPYTLRVTDIYGRSLTDSAVPLAEAQVVPGGGQFPAP